MEISNKIRGFAYMYRVFNSQKNDPFCPNCNSYATTLASVTEAISKFEAEAGEAARNLDPAMSRLFSDARSGIMSLTGPETPIRQKKEGNCKLPEGVCFLKNSFAILQKCNP